MAEFEVLGVQTLPVQPVRLTPHERHERTAVHAAGRGQAAHVEQRGHQVGQAHGRFGVPAARGEIHLRGEVQDEGHADRTLVPVGLRPVMVVAHHVAVVAHEGEDQIAQLEHAPHVISEPRDLGVHVIDAAVISRPGPPDVLAGQGEILGFREGAVGLDEGRASTHVTGRIADDRVGQIGVVRVSLVEERRRVPGRMGLAEGYEQEEGRVMAVIPRVLIHDADGLRGRPGGHVEFFGEDAGTGRVPVVGHARVEQAELAPSLLRQPVDVIIPVSGRQEPAFLVGYDPVEAAGFVLGVDVPLPDTVGLVAVALEYPAERVRFVPGRHVVESDHAVGDRPLTAEEGPAGADA